MRRLITAASVLAMFAATATPAIARNMPSVARRNAVKTHHVKTHRRRHHHTARDRSVCPAVPERGQATCYALVAVHPHASSSPSAGPNVSQSVVNPAGYHPADLQQAYGLASVAASAGAGQTVAIVDAYNDPNAAANLATYRSTFGLPACGAGCFTQVDETGAAKLPANSTAWSQEISLDLDMVSAVCPKCKILLVEANSTSFGDLLAAENYATAHATEVTNSWGAPEFSGETSFDSYFKKSVPITFAAGDAGYGVQYPASSPYVTAVGGTTLSRANVARGFTETTWAGTGSGCSAYEPKPVWQKDTGCARRTVTDVSAVANPSTGVSVYDTYQQPGWQQFGGTSVSAPIVAGVYALAGGFKSALYGSLPYVPRTGALFDVVGGTNGKCPVAYLCTAVPGFDGPTGLGSPDGIAGF